MSPSSICTCIRSPSLRRPLQTLLGSASASPLRLSGPSSLARRSHPPMRYYSDHQQFRTRHGTIKVNLKAKHTVGIAQSRGERPYQEDAFTIASLALPQQALKRNIVTVKEGAGWTNDTLEGFSGENDEGQERLRQVAFFGVFDGHGGSQVSKHLQNSLAKRIETCQIEDISPTISSYRALGGYLRRYRGGPLDRFRPNHPHPSPEPSSEPPLSSGPSSLDQRMGLDELCVLSFLMSDVACLSDPSTGKSGSVATVALLHSLDLPHALPFYLSQSLALTIAHLGDTRAILASTSTGRAKALTETHHADSRIESERLRQSGTGLVTDSFGESRWGGALANTRGIGDREFKTLGVIGEPEVHTLVLKGPEWSFLVLVTDGITDSMSDQEIVDLVRGVQDPSLAAKKIVTFAEDVGGEDNMTCLVVPLGGWGKMGGVDVSASRREYRLSQVQGTSSRQKRM